MYAKCQLLSKPFFFSTREKMLLIRGLSNLQSVGGAVALRERDSLLLREDMTKIQLPQGCAIFWSQDFFLPY